MLSDLEGMLLRPSMYGTQSGYEQSILGRLADLAFVDERNETLTALLERLRESRTFISTGVCGALSYYHFPKAKDLTDETASIYAWLASQLDYFEPARRLDAPEWRGLNRRLSKLTSSPRLSPAEVIAEIGPPSYSRQGQSPRVFAYAPLATAEGWIYFDFVGPIQSLRLRNLRMPVADFRRSVSLVNGRARK